MKNLVPGKLVNGSLGRVLCFATCDEARKERILTATSILENSLEARAKWDSKSLKELRRLQKSPTEIDEVDGYWPIVEFTNSQRVIFTPMPFDTEDAFGHLEATRVQVIPFCHMRVMTKC